MFAGLGNEGWTKVMEAQGASILGWVSGVALHGTLACVDMCPFWCMREFSLHLLAAHRMMRFNFCDRGIEKCCKSALMDSSGPFLLEIFVIRI